MIEQRGPAVHDGQDVLRARLERYRLLVEFDSPFRVGLREAYSRARRGEVDMAEISEPLDPRLEVRKLAKDSKKRPTARASGVREGGAPVPVA